MDTANSWTEYDNKEAREAIAKLRTQHGLSFHQDPGGGCFRDPQTGKEFHFPMMDDVADYEALKAWIAELEKVKI